MNNQTIIGRLTRDPELKYTPNGNAVCSFSVAVNRRFNKDVTDYFNVTAWKKAAELCAQYLTKGSQVAINGRMESRKYENKDGQKVTVWELQVDEVQFLDSKKSGDKPADRPANQQSSANDSWSDLGKEIRLEDIDVNDDQTIPF